MFAQEVQLRLGLHALSDHRHAEDARHLDDRGRDSSVVGIGRDGVNEAAVDLECIDRVTPQAGEARIAGAEVIERDAHAECLERAEGGFGIDGARDQRVRSDLDLERVRRDAVPAERLGDLGGEAGLQELSARDVDRDADAFEAVLFPLGDLSADGVEHPPAHVDDEPGVVQHVDEDGGGHGTDSGARPAEQRFGARPCAALQSHLRLVVHLELVPVECMPERGLEREGVRREPVGLGQVEADGIATGRARRAEGSRRADEQEIGLALVGRRDRDADAERGGEVVAIDRDRFAQRVPEPLRDRLSGIGVAGGRDEDHAELRALETSQCAHGAEAGEEPVTDLGEQCGADRPAEDIIDDVEAIDADEEHGDLLGRGLSAREGLDQQLAVPATVWQPSELVVLLKQLAVIA